MTVHTTKPPKMPVNLAGIPDELKRIPNWHVWKWEWKEKSQKWDKPPYAIDGSYGSSTDSAKWCTFEEAVAALPRFDGLGLAMGDGISYVGVDLDSCRDPESGFLSIEAQSIVDDLGTYCEISPSKTGVKLWLKGDYDKTKWRSKVGNVEVYCNGRYFTVSGHCNDKPIAEVGPKFFAFLDKHLTKPKPSEEAVNDRAPIGASDDPKFMEIALKACLKVEVPETENDGSRRVTKLCRQCVRYGLTPDGCVKIVRKAVAFAPLPVAWSDDEIKTRYKQALEETKLGEAIKPDEQFEPYYEKSDYGVAKRVRDLLGDRAMFIREWGKWVTWNGRYFSIGVAEEVMEATVKVSKQLLEKTPPDKGTKESEKEIKEYRSFCMKYQSWHGMDAIRKTAEKMMSRSFTELDKRTELFHCDNFTLKLNNDTGEVTPLAHSPEYKNTQITQVVYSPEAKCPHWTQFIHEVTCNEKGESRPALADYLQKLVGFCLTGRTDDQSIYIMHGGGNNGKGAFCRTVLKILGGYGANIQQSLLIETRKQEHQTQFATLYGKRCVITSETDQGCKLNEAQVKNLTGSDGIRCRRMREDEWEFEPTHKILLATNNLPTIRGTDNGIWRRVKLIPFTANITPNIDLERIHLPSELSGILNWALEGFRKVVLEGMSMPKEVEEAKAEYRNDMDIVKQFVEDKCILSPELTVTNEKLFLNVKQYCDGLGQHTPSIRKITFDLHRLGVSSERNNTMRFKKGIGLIAELEV